MLPLRLFSGAQVVFVISGARDGRAVIIFRDEACRLSLGALWSPVWKLRHFDAPSSLPGVRLIVLPAKGHLIHSLRVANLFEAFAWAAIAPAVWLVNAPVLI